MRCLAICDLFIDESMMKEGLRSLEEYGISIDYRTWSHESLELLQLDNIALEQRGSDAVSLEDELVKNIEEYDILITQFAPISSKVIDRGTKLKYIGVLRAGIENVNHAYAESKGIKVFNTPGRSNTSVPEFTVGMILAEMRNIGRAHLAMKQGKWVKEYPGGVLAPELKTSVVGLIGYGEIGRRVANLIRPFGSKVIFFDEYYLGETADEKVDFDELIKTADIISMHYRLTDETKNMLSKVDFEKMKPNAIVINTARAGLINEKDLIDALKNNLIRGAAIDVFNDEPLYEGHPYLELDNVTLTPHIAGSTTGNFGFSPNILSRILLDHIKS